MGHGIQMKYVNYLPAPAYFKLNQAVAMIDRAFDVHGTFGTYLVGSCLKRRDFRDVDVRMIMENEAYDKLFPGAIDRPDLNAYWSLTCVTIADWLARETGLPVDFQIQRQSTANEEFPTHGGVHENPRNALGIFLGYPGGK
jgi:hypothetical protein